MSIGLLSNIGGSAAGTSLAQTRGSDVDRAQQESKSRQLQAQTEQSADEAAGVGQTDGENHETADRDADGRRLWEIPQRKGPEDSVAAESHSPAVPDPSGQCGGLLDLTG